MYSETGSHKSTFQANQTRFSYCPPKNPLPATETSRLQRKDSKCSPRQDLADCLQCDQASSGREQPLSLAGP